MLNNLAQKNASNSSAWFAVFFRGNLFLRASTTVDYNHLK